ncbi:MAG: 23S rRNA (adenine(2503)-C(2))-methyltransferase RlmN [bacterium]
MTNISRAETIKSLFPKEPDFRLKQIETALFQKDVKDWSDISTLPAAMRETLSKEIPFTSLEVEDIYSNKADYTFKAIARVATGEEIETVMMKNSRGHFTICVSSQIGCAMKCAFCATGKMGLTRNLEADEIVDQYRVWQTFLANRPELPQFISNIVYMGMGEPMANYENVKQSLNCILENTEIGKTHITVSSVGVIPRLEMLLSDPDWPHVRMAISLHSADEKTRKEIMPTSYDDFLPKLADWSRRYLERFGNRRHHLTFEYVMLKDVNDTPHHAKLLAKFSNSIGDVRVNLIPYNFTDCGFQSSTKETITAFYEALEKHGVTTTVRKSQGEDISAACGQLIKNA